MLEIREMNMKDKEAVKHFFVSVFTKEPWNDDWSDEEQLEGYIRDLIGNPNSLTIGLFDHEEMVGLSMGHIKHWYQATEYYIDELCIKTEVQGKGYGKTFVREIENLIQSRGIKQIFLQTERDVPAYRFYKKQGFYELDNHVSFVKSLGDSEN